MSRTFMTDAINIKSHPLNEHDSIITMFSRNNGLMRAIAKGAKRPKSKLGARSQMFIANRMMLAKGRNLDIITQAQSLKTFSKIRANLDKLSYSMYIAELVENFCSKEFNNDENYEEIYDLIFYTYDKIANATKDEEVIFATLKFQIKLMNFLGWGLDFKLCAKCQKDIEDDLDKSCVFSHMLNSFLCIDCAEDMEGNFIRIHNKIRLFLDEISKVDYDKKTKYDDLVNFVVLERCFIFMKKYIDALGNKKTKVFEVLEKVKLL